MAKLSWGTAAAVAIGACCGFGLMLIYQPNDGAARGNGEGVTTRQSSAQDDQQRLKALEAQVASLRREKGTSPEAIQAALAMAAAQTETDQPAAPPRDAESAKAEFAKWSAAHEQNLSMHRAQGRDPKWAPEMEASLTQQFGGLPAGTLASIDEVECRTSSCAVRITWPSQEAAKNEFELVAQAVALAPCSREIGLPADAPVEGPINVDFYLGCARQPNN